MKRLHIESILKNAKMGIWSIQIDFQRQDHKLFADPTMCQLMGIPEDTDPIQAYALWWQGVHPSYRGYIQEAISNMRTGQDIEVEYPWYHPQLGCRYVRCAGQLVDQNETFMELQGYHQDVSDLVKENTHLGEEYQILDFFKFKKYSSMVMHAYEAMCEVDVQTYSYSLIFGRQKIVSKTPAQGDLISMVQGHMSASDFQAFQSFLVHWDPDKKQQSIELCIDSKWMRIIGSTARFNQKDRLLLWFIDITDEKAMTKVREEKEALLKILSGSHTDVLDIDLNHHQVHFMHGQDQTIDEFVSSLYTRYSQSEKQSLQDFFSPSHLQTMTDQETIEIQLDEKKTPFGWDRITLMPSREEKDHILATIQSMDPGHFVQMIMSRYIENNYQILCYIDMKNDLFIPLRVKGMRFDKKATQSYAQTVSSYIEGFVVPEDQAAARESMLPQKILTSLQKEKLYYFSLGIQNEGSYRRMLFQYHYFDRSQDLVLLMISDVTEQYLQEEEEKRQMELIRIQANTDHLTGLSNRYACETQIKEYFDQDGKKELSAFLLIDLDDFKEVNDTFGHIAGDKALVDIGNALKQYFRSTDIISRFGGDEFVVFMKNIKEENVLFKLMERLLKQLVFVYEDAQHRIELKASIGVAIAPKDGQHIEALYQKADKALYRIKNQGKNNFALYDAAIDEECS